MAARFVHLLGAVQLIALAACTLPDYGDEVPVANAGFRADTAFARQLVETGEVLAEKSLCDSALALFDVASEHYRMTKLWTRLVYCNAARANCMVSLARFDEAQRIISESLLVGEEHMIESDPALGETYSALGRLRLQEHRYEDALEAHEKALAIRRNAFGEEHVEVADSYAGIAGIYLFIGDYERAESFYHKALRLQRRAWGETHSSIASVYTDLGYLYTETGKYDRAVELLRKALSIKSSILGDDHPALASTLKNLGEANRLRGDYRQALEAHQEALAIAEHTLGETQPLVAAVLNNLGIVHVETGDPEAAIPFYKRAIAIRQKLGGTQNPAIANSFNNLGVAYMTMGDYDRALTYLENGLRIRREHFGEIDRGVAIYLNNIRSVYSRKGELEDARIYCKKALRAFIASLGEEHPYVANQYNLLGGLLNAMGDHTGALTTLEKALQIFYDTSGEQDPYVSAVYRSLGVVYDSLDVPDRALEYHRMALHHSSDIYGDHHPYVARHFNDMGSVYSKNASYHEALASYEYAQNANRSTVRNVETSETSPVPEILSDPIWLKSLAGKARTYSTYAMTKDNSGRDLQEALGAYYQAAHTLDRMQKRYRNQGSRLHWVEVAAPLMADAVAVSFALYEATGEEKYKAAAFYFAEKSKGSVLLGALSDARARRFAGIPDSLLKEERMLLASLVSTEQRLLNSRTGAKESAPSDVKRLEQEAFALTQQHTALIEQIEHTYPNYYKLKYDVEVATPERVRTSGLGPETALVEYMIGDEQVFIFTMTPADFNVLAVPRNPDLEQQVEDLRQGIVRQDYEKYTTNARALYLQLLDPVVRSLDARNLLIVPDGVLNYVPFESLLTDSPGRAPRKDYGSLPYLIKRFAVSYAYSSTLLIETRGRQRSEPDRDYVAFAPVSSDGLPAGSPGAALLQKYTSSPTANTTGWGYLPMTRIEVTQIKDLFGQTYSFFERLFRPRSRVYLGKDARESEVMSDEMSRYRYVHFATHGFANSTSPESSGIVLYSTTSDAVSDNPDSVHEPELDWSEDGVLRLDEVYALRLNADVVVLSACETGLGPVARGEGILSLARGFLYAGASNVVASLWKADDVQTQRLMLGFYRNMLDGSATSSSLRHAKLNLIDENGRYARPYYWATFVLIGA